ncbi:MAG: hypothetical protein U0P45_14180 [Acidimicrobiales bacterium]
MSSSKDAKPVLVDGPGAKGAKGSRLSPKTKAALATVAITALERLSDPKVRAQLADQGRSLAKQVSAWREQRSAGTAGRRSRVVRGLEQRATKIRAAIAAVSSERPDRLGTLQEAGALLDEIDLAIGVADGLPKGTRKEAIARVDAELDRVERLVFDASLPRPRG